MLAIYFYLVCLYIRPQDWPGGFLYGQPLTFITLIIAIVLAVFENSKQQIKFNLPQIYLLVLYVFTVYVLTILNVEFGSAITVLTTYTKTVIIFFVFFVIVNSVRRLRNVIVFSLLLIMIIAIQAKFQTITGYGLAGQALQAHGYAGQDSTRTEHPQEREPVVIEELAEVRANYIGAWDGPNVMSTLFVMAIGLILPLTRPQNTFVKRIIAVILMIVFVVGIQASGSRGAYLSLGLSVMTFLAYVYRKHFIKLLVYGTLGIILLAIVGGSVGEISSEDDSNQERVWIWERGMNKFRERPLLGIGKMQFGESSGGVLMIAHSNYLTSFVELGLIGFYLYIGVLYFSLKGLYGIFTSVPETKEQKELCVLALGLCFSYLGYCVATAFITMELDFLYAWWATYAATINIAKKKFSGFGLSASRKDFINIAVIVVIIIMGYYFQTTYDFM